jgi:hypothetical protein
MKIKSIFLVLLSYIWDHIGDRRIAGWENLVASGQDSGSTVYTSDGSPVVSLSNKPVEKAFFTPDSRRLHFTVENSLSAAASPDLKPLSHPDGTSLFGWVGY